MDKHLRIKNRNGQGIVEMSIYGIKGTRNKVRRTPSLQPTLSRQRRARRQANNNLQQQNKYAERSGEKNQSARAPCTVIANKVKQSLHEDCFVTNSVPRNDTLYGH